MNRPLKKYFPFAVFLAVALASLIMAGFAYFATDEAGRIKFEGAADDALSRIEGKIDLHLSLLRAAHAFFNARHGEVSRDEFKAFIDDLDVDKSYTGMRGIGFMRLVAKGDEAVAEEGILKDQGLARKIWPDSSAGWRLPVTLFEPLDQAGLAGIGFDMYSDPNRRSALDAAIDGPGPRATGRLQIGDSTGERQYPGFFVFLRLDAAAAPSLMGDSSAPAAGLLYAVFRANDLFGAALGKAPLLPVNVEVYETRAEPDKLLYRSQTPPNPNYAETLLVTRELVVAGQPWVVQFRPTAAFVLPSSKVTPIMLGVIGLILAGAIAMLARWQERAYAAVESLHSASEKSLLEKELMLQEMKHRIKNSITRVLAMARQTAANSKDVEEFSASFSARLQAMANSQDMLTRSRWQKADLGELLKTELAQVFGKNLDAQTLSGPDIKLDETATQALGLTFHELATNALKYGDAGRGKGGLRVEWRVNGKGARKTLALTWSEASGENLSAPEKTGFGTRLIDMNITRELGGTISREYLGNGLRVEIEIPLAD